jgi:hypothetical protein
MRMATRECHLSKVLEMVIRSDERVPAESDSKRKDVAKDCEV